MHADGLEFYFKSNRFKLNLHLPRKANLAMTPVCFPTKIEIPVSKKGAVKSTAFCRSELIFTEVTITSARPLVISLIKPFQVLF